MKALVLEKVNQFRFREFPDPNPGQNEVLIRVKSCGICGSDVHGMDGSTGRRLPPLIMGHEASGEIAGVGSAVHDWKEGDRVTFDSTVYCGKCAFCQCGKVNLCDTRQVLGVSCSEYYRNGAFAEFVVVPEHILYRLPSSVSYDQAAMIEAVSVAVHAVERNPVSPRDSVLVVGVGMIGLLIIQVLRIVRCGKIIAVDLDADRLNMAADFGADFCLKANLDDVVSVIRGKSGGLGVNRSFEVVGLTPSFQVAVEATQKGGNITLVGNLSNQVELPLQSVVTRELSLHGSCASAGEYPGCLDLISSGSIDVDRLISATPPLGDGALWFERLYKKEPGLMKVILKP